MPADLGKIVHRTMLTGAAVACLAFLVVMIAPAAVDVDRGEGLYWGARVLPPGPASQGQPVIPVRVSPSGLVAGQPDRLDWYQFNDLVHSPGTSADYPGNDTFYYGITAEKLNLLAHQKIQPWWVGMLGQPVRGQDFPSEWSGAPAIWRSSGQEGQDVIRVVVIRVPEDAYPSATQQRFAPDGFIAFTASDSRNGCTLDYDTNLNPRARLDQDHALLFDPCHDSRYDPRELRAYPLPIPEWS